MKISMSNYGTCNRTLACITNLQSNYSLTQTHNITLNGLLFWSQLTEPCWHLLQFTITELYLGISYNSDHTNKTLHWHVFAILGSHLKKFKTLLVLRSHLKTLQLHVLQFTLTESNIGVFSCSEVTLCRISARWSVVSPSSSSTLRSAPLLTRSSTMEVWPWDTARSSGVCWRLFLISMLAWPCRRN